MHKPSLGYSLGICSSQRQWAAVTISQPDKIAPPQVGSSLTIKLTYNQIIITFGVLMNINSKMIKFHWGFSPKLK